MDLGRSSDRRSGQPSSTGWAMACAPRSGPAPRGLAGMADSHDEARVVRRVAELRGLRPGTVIGYRTADLTALLTADPVEAVRFAEASSGNYLVDNDTAGPARATVRVYLEENLSPARAARRLGIRQNTVVYRVKQTAVPRTYDRATAPAARGSVSARRHDRRPARGRRPRTSHARRGGCPGARRTLR